MTTTTTTARIAAVLSVPGGSLVLRARPAGGAPLRFIVPAGPLAARLARAMEAGETWRLTLAADGQTVLQAQYGEGSEA